MGLDLSLLLPDASVDAGWSYHSFARFRRRLAEAAGLGDLNAYLGYGGAKAWPGAADEPLVPLLHHSDCEGVLWGWECEGLADRLRSLIRLWPEDDYDRRMGERLATMFERADRHGGVVKFH